MKSLILIAVLGFSLVSFAAEEKIKMYFNNEDIVKVIEIYSKASGQKFVVDPSVRGRISLFLQEPVTLAEAFNQLSSMLALNGYGISKQDDTMVVMSARNVQRNLIEVGTDIPSVKPQRMYTWIYKVKNMPATDVNSDLRLLTSKDGEMSVVSSTNQLIITDWSSNIQRIAELMEKVDQKADPVFAAKNAARKAEFRKMRNKHAERNEDVSFKKEADKSSSGPNPNQGPNSPPAAGTSQN